MSQLSSDDLGALELTEFCQNFLFGCFYGVGLDDKVFFKQSGNLDRKMDWKREQKKKRKKERVMLDKLD